MKGRPAPRSLIPQQSRSPAVEPKVSALKFRRMFFCSSDCLLACRSPTVAWRPRSATVRIGGFAETTRHRPGNHAACAVGASLHHRQAGHGKLSAGVPDGHHLHDHRDPSLPTKRQEETPWWVILIGSTLGGSVQNGLMFIQAELPSGLREQLRLQNGALVNCGTAQQRGRIGGRNVEAQSDRPNTVSLVVTRVAQNCSNMRHPSPWSAPRDESYASHASRSIAADKGIAWLAATKPNPFAHLRKHGIELLSFKRVMPH